MLRTRNVVLAVLAGYVGLVPAASAGQVIEPRKIAGPGELRSGESALLLSIRHQTPLSQTMHVRFVSVDDPTRVLKFERKVGLGGRTRMLERQVGVYAIPAGRWRLASHLAGCDDSIEPGQECVLSLPGNGARYLLPSGTYPADWFVITAPERGFTDADELNLEFPSDTVLGVPTTDSADDRIRSLQFKARSIPAADKPIAQKFAGLPRGSVSAAAQAASATTCERPAKALKLYYNPFTC